MNFIGPVRATDYAVNYFQSDKQDYYVDETIYFNFSGYLDYEPAPPLVDSFFQICLVNSSTAGPEDDESLIWHGPEYHDGGEITKEFNLTILELGVIFPSIEYINLYLKIRYYYFNIYEPTENLNIYLESHTIEINIHKRGMSCLEINHFEIDKGQYYIDESVILNASWTLTYVPAPPLVDAFLQFCLFNESDALLWNSTEYHEPTSMEIVQPIVLSNLTFTEINTTCSIMVRLYYYFHEDDTDDLYLSQHSTFFNVSKRGLTCLEVHDMSTDKDEYFINEHLQLSASWTLNYTTSHLPFQAFVQLCLFNNSDNLIWNSTKYHDNTTIELNEVFDLMSMGLPISRMMNVFYFKLRFFYYFGKSDTGDLYLEEFTCNFNISIIASSYVQVHYLTMNKASSFPEECLHVNASWTMNPIPSPPLEDVFLQVCLYNETNVLLWNSSEFRKTYPLELKWEINLTNLDMHLTQLYTEFYIKIRLFSSFGEGCIEDLFLEEYTCMFYILPHVESCVEVYSLLTNKENYTYGENVNLNCAWTLHDAYNIQPAVQICVIEDISGNLIWNSTEYTNTDRIEASYSLPSRLLLNCSIYNPIKLRVQMLLLYWNETVRECIEITETLPIHVFKGLISHRLITFQDSMECGEEQIIHVQYYNLNDDKIAIKNGTLVVSIFKDNTWLSKNVICLDCDVITIEISSKDLNIGKNLLLFNLTSVFNHQNYIFDTEITLRKIDVVFRVINITLQENRIIGEVKYFLNRHDHRFPLMNENVSVFLFNESSLLRSDLYITNGEGSLFLNFSLPSFKEQAKEVFLKFVNAGNSTVSSEEHVLKLSLSTPNIIENSSKNSSFILMSAFLSVMGVVSTIIATIMRKGMREGAVSLKKHRFRY